MRNGMKRISCAAAAVVAFSAASFANPLPPPPPEPPCECDLFDFKDVPEWSAEMSESREKMLEFDRALVEKFKSRHENLRFDTILFCVPVDAKMKVRCWMTDRGHFFRLFGVPLPYLPLPDSEERRLLWILGRLDGPKKRGVTKWRCYETNSVQFARCEVKRRPYFRESQETDFRFRGTGFPIDGDFSAGDVLRADWGERHGLIAVLHGLVSSDTNELAYAYKAAEKGQQAYRDSHRLIRREQRWIDSDF